MNKRELLKVMGAASLASLSTQSLARTADAASSAVTSGSGTGTRAGAMIPSSLSGHSFFLSATNPVATVDQRELEATALEVLQRREVKAAKEQMTNRYKTIVGDRASEQAWDAFQTLVDEFAYRYTVQATLDPNHPKVLGGMYQPPHEWFGKSVPGTRSGEGDGPDTNYSLIPVSWDAHYEVYGRRFQPFPADGSLAVVCDIGVSTPQSHLQMSDVQVDPDGTFVLTMGPEPANGRPNHIQLKPDALYLFLRCNRSDWRQVPNAYRVRRLDPPSAAPLTIAQIAERAARFMVLDVNMNYYFVRLFDVLEPNKILGPINSGTIGGMSTQRGALAQVKLRDDEAFVLTLSGAPYRFVGLFDYWFRSRNYGDHLACMNNSQASSSSDGMSTFVISLSDPGVQNWLDPVGYREPRLWVRWQGVQWTEANAPSIKGELVKMNELQRVLPAATKRVSAQERKAQLAQRKETYLLRWRDT